MPPGDPNTRCTDVAAIHPTHRPARTPLRFVPASAIVARAMQTSTTCERYRSGRMMNGEAIVNTVVTIGQSHDR